MDETKTTLSNAPGHPYRSPILQQAMVYAVLNSLVVLMGHPFTDHDAPCVFEYDISVPVLEYCLF